MIIGTLPDGARGVDVNQTVTADDAQAFATAGYTFIVRYVRRSQPHTATDAYVGAATMLLGALLMAPASLSRAVEVLKPLIPWGRRATDIMPPDEDKK